MKYILTILLLATFANASYAIYFTGLKLGDIENFDTLKNNYLEAKVTNSIARFLLGKDKFVYYDENDYVGKKNDENTKYKKDKYGIITILKKASSNNLKNERIVVKKEKYVDVELKDNYKFKYTSKGKVKSDGFFIMKDGKLVTLEETINNIKIVKNP